MFINLIISNHLSKLWKLLPLSSIISEESYSDDLRCSPGNILYQANMFQQLLSKDNFWSACYGRDYLTMVYLADSDNSRPRKKLFFDIGANKGYTIASWLSTWMPQLGVNSISLYKYLSQTLNITDCGACLDCKETMMNNVHLSNHLGSTLEIHGFEPMKSTYEVLGKVRTWINMSTLYIHKIAMSNMSGRANMNKCPVGAESCGLVSSADQSRSNENIFQTETITLDDFVQQKGISQKIDLLKIDTEGADPLVLQGAKKLFAQQQIRLMIFENHGVGIWKITSLLKVIESLDRDGFICYMIGKTGLARLTNCWSPVYHIKQWSNVLCVHRREKRLRRFIELLLITNI